MRDESRVGLWVSDEIGFCSKFRLDLINNSLWFFWVIPGVLNFIVWIETHFSSQYNINSELLLNLIPKFGGYFIFFLRNV